MLHKAYSELYNNGIVDVSHRYPKMYITSSVFIQIIKILRNAALNSMQYKAEFALVRGQNVNINNFEEKMYKFKEGFYNNYKMVIRNFSEAIMILI